MHQLSRLCGIGKLKCAGKGIVIPGKEIIVSAMGKLVLKYLIPAFHQTDIHGIQTLFICIINIRRSIKKPAHPCNHSRLKLHMAVIQDSLQITAATYSSFI